MASNQDEGIALTVENAWHNYDLHIYEVTEKKNELALLGFRFEFSRLKSGSRGLTAEIVVYLEGRGDTLDRPPKQFYGPTEVNLLATSWRQNAGLKGTLEKGLPEYQWEGLLQNIISTTITDFRGSMSQASSNEYEQDEDEYPFLVNPFIMESGVTVLFGPGGTGKSTLALGMALSVASDKPHIGDFVHKSGPVLWVDYEANHKEVFDRLNAVLRETGDEHPEHAIHYRKYGSKFVDIVSDIRREIRELKPELIVVDSVANARRGDANGAEDTVNMFAVMNTLEVPVLAIDHMSAEAAARQDFTKPYGTVYTSNEARLTWGVMVNESASTPEVKQLNMKMSKQNIIKQADARGIVLRYESFETGKVRSLKFTENAGIWDADFNSMTNSERLIRVFKENGTRYLTKKQLEEDAEMSQSVVYRTIAAMDNGGIVEKKSLSTSGGGMAYRLVETQ